MSITIGIDAAKDRLDFYTSTNQYAISKNDEASIRKYLDGLKAEMSEAKVVVKATGAKSIKI